MTDNSFIEINCLWKCIDINIFIEPMDTLILLLIDFQRGKTNAVFADRGIKFCVGSSCHSIRRYDHTREHFSDHMLHQAERFFFVVYYRTGFVDQDRFYLNFILFCNF